MFLFWTFIVAVLAIQTKSVVAQSCRTPNGLNGNCVSVYECQALLAILNNQRRTQQDEKFLRDSQCGTKNSVPAVCCPCNAADGQQGNCVNINSCPYVLQLLKNPNEANLNYVRGSVCQGSEQQSICCVTAPQSTAVTTTPRPKRVHACQSEMTATPPNPEGKCCGRDIAVGDKIVGGAPASIDSYPWLVVIEYVRLERTMLLCGGALISGKYVLTAGHCVKGAILDVGTPKTVRLGEYNTTNPGRDCVSVSAGGTDCTDPLVKIGIEKTIPHPDYQPYHFLRKHDIGLIRLQSIAPFTDFIRPICLPSTDYTVNPPSKFALTVAGWGRYLQFDNGTVRSSKIKLHVTLPFVQRDVCEANQKPLRNGQRITLWKGQMCAGGEAGKDSCKGDSGGPLMYEHSKKYEAVGIVSFGPEKCGQIDIPGVYTNVYEYLPWIQNTIEP